MRSKLPLFFILILVAVVFSSCSVSTIMTIDRNGNLFLTKVSLLSSYNEYAEIGAKQFLSLLGLSKDFLIVQGQQDMFAIEQSLDVIPVNGPWQIDLSKNTEITITDSSFRWKIYDRNNLFPATKKDEIVLKIIIKIEKDVDIANTTDVKGNVYTWSLTYAQLQTGVELKVIFK